MRTALRVLVLSACLAAPASGAPVTVDVEAWFTGQLSEEGLVVVDWLARVTPGGLDSQVFFTSGPILNISLEDSPFPADDHTRYALDAGRIDIVDSWVRADGSLQQGTFSAPMPGFDFVTAEIGMASSGHAVGVLGPGVFDRNLSRFLGVERGTLGGSYEMYVDVHSALEEGLPRFIGTNQTLFHIAVTPIPEPSGLALLTLAGVGMAGRRHRRS